MHITHPLKRNIFTGLWHRTLPTLHGILPLSLTSSPFSAACRFGIDTRTPDTCQNKKQKKDVKGEEKKGKGPESGKLT